MPTTRSPRHGSMQFWPRKRAKRHYARVRSWPNPGKAQLLGFAGYKAGMTIIMADDNRKHSRSKGQEIAIPATVIECPPIKIASVRLYKKDAYGMKLTGEISGKADDDLRRKIVTSKKAEANSLDSIDPKQYDDIRVNVYTQPRLTGIGKKKPELFEVGIGGKIEEKLAFAKDNLGKEVFINQVFEEGNQLDFHAVTKGKGFQGPVKRFGIGLKSHKSEKSRRNPGSLGGWKAQGHFMYRVAHAGQTGYHTRTEYNKWLLKIADKPEDVNPSGGFKRYGTVRNHCIIVKGSVQGPAKRIVRFNISRRPNTRLPKEAPGINLISLESKQGN